MRCPNCLIDLPLRDDKYECNECMFIAYPNTEEIKEIYAFFSVDENGNEGICVVNSGLGPAPMVCNSLRVASLMKPKAQKMAPALKMKIRMVKFSNKEILEEYK